MKPRKMAARDALAVWRTWIRGNHRKLVCFRQAPGCLYHFCAASLNPLGSSLQFSASSFPCTHRPSASTIESSASHTLTFLSGTRRSIDGLLGLRESRRGVFFDGPRWRITAPRNAQLVLHETLIQLRERTSVGTVENECSKLAPLSHCKRSENRRAAASQHKPSVCMQSRNLPNDVLRHMKLTQQTSAGVNVFSRRGQDGFRHVEVSESGADGFARTATLVVGGHAENGLLDDVVESFAEVNKRWPQQASGVVWEARAVLLRFMQSHWVGGLPRCAGFHFFEEYSKGALFTTKRGPDQKKQMREMNWCTQSSNGMPPVPGPLRGVILIMCLSTR